MTENLMTGVREEIEGRIDRELIDSFSSVFNRKDKAFDLRASLVRSWKNRPFIDLLDSLPLQDPTRLILVSHDHREERIVERIGIFKRRQAIKKIRNLPAYKAIQIHARIQEKPRFATFVYQLALTENQPGMLRAYKDIPLIDSDNSLSMSLNFTERIATLDDLEMFNIFLDNAQPVTPILL